MNTRTVHVAVYDTLADWEVGFAVAGINNPDFQADPGSYRIATVATTTDPVTTIGGITIQPDRALDGLDPVDSAMLILPGNTIWAGEEFRSWTEAARRWLDAKVPVAAICGVTGGLALAGMLDDRPHTSNAWEYLEALGYAGGDHYVDAPAVTDGDLITAAASAPIEFAREIFARLGVYPPDRLAAWYQLYGEQDPAGFYALTS